MIPEKFVGSTGIISLIFLLPFFLFQTVTSANETLRKRVESVVDMALITVSTLSEMYSGNASSVETDIMVNPAEKAPDTGAPGIEEGSNAME